jgi:hypothetical protein
MSTQTTSEYMLLFRGTGWHKGLSPEETQEVVKQMNAWLDRLTAEGKAKAGKPGHAVAGAKSQGHGPLKSKPPRGPKQPHVQPAHGHGKAKGKAKGRARAHARAGR